MASSSEAVAAAAAAVSWADLPQDVLTKIASLQTFFVDLFRFRSVCRSWRSAAHNLLPRHLSPFLMSPDEADPLTMHFYSVRDGRPYRLRFPADSVGWRCCGSSYGWLAMLGPDASARLFHPFSGTRLDLPPLTTLPDVRRAEIEGTNAMFVLEPLVHTSGLRMVMTVGGDVLRDVHVEKAVLAMDPSSSDPAPLAVLLLLHDLGGVVYALPGDEAWTPIPVPQGFIRDVVYHCGLFYGLCLQFEMVFTIDLFSGDRPTVTSFPHSSEWGIYGLAYLVVLPSGVILQVRRGMGHGVGPVKTESFQVVRLNLDNPKKWVCVKALRGISLFLDRHCSTALYTSSISEKGRRNCIYFAQDEDSVGYDRDCLYSDSDFGVFRLQDKAFEWGLPAGVEMTMNRPIWVMLSD